MATLRLLYPVIRFHSINIDVSEEEAETVENMNLEEQAKYIELKNEELQKLEMLIDRKNLIGALDTDYATIKRLTYERKLMQ